MTVSPWWGSTASSLYAIVSNAPETITNFEIRGADQSDSEYQSCTYMNAGAFQCSISNGPLTEPASVRMNDGTYVGVDIIVSMDGSADEYPLESCTTDSSGTKSPTAPTPNPTDRPTVAPPAPAAPTVPTPKPTSPSGSTSTKEVIGYYASWQWYDRSKLAEPKNLDYSKVTIVNFAFFQTDTQGYLYGTDSWADPQVLFGPQNWNPSDDSSSAPDYRCHWSGPNKKACGHYKLEDGLIYLVHQAGAKIYPSLGGWTLSDNFPKVAADAAKRTRFAEQCVELIKDYDFDGIDLDWEYPAYKDHSGTPEDTENFVLLLQELRSKLDEYGATTGKYYEITAAVGCGPSVIAGYDIPNTAPLLDQINLMTYDFFGAWSDRTGANAPVYYQGFPDGDEWSRWNVDGCVKNWREGGAVDTQLNIGLPFYGQSFVGATGMNQEHGGNDKVHWGVDDGKPQYFNIEKRLPEMTQMRHEASKTQMAWFSGGGFISFDDEQAICDKVEYVLENDLNGFIIWELSGDVREDLSTPLLDEVNLKLNNPNRQCSASSSAFTADNAEEGGGGLSSAATALIVICVLLCVAGAAAGVVMWRWRKTSGTKATVPDMEEVEAAEDGVQADEMTMEVEIEVNDTKRMMPESATTTQD